MKIIVVYSRGKVAIFVGFLCFIFFMLYAIILLIEGILLYGLLARMRRLNCRLDSLNWLIFFFFWSN